MPKTSKEMASKIASLNEYQYWYFDQLYNDHLDCKTYMETMLKKYNLWMDWITVQSLRYYTVKP